MLQPVYRVYCYFTGYHSKIGEESNETFSIAKFYPFLRLCNYMCENFADGFVARIQVKLSLTLLIAGVFGFVFECLNAFEYLQGTRLALIDSSLAVTTMLFILCFVRGELKLKNPEKIFHNHF